MTGVHLNQTRKAGENILAGRITMPNLKRAGKKFLGAWWWTVAGGVMLLWSPDQTVTWQQVGAKKSRRLVLVVGFFVV